MNKKLFFAIISVLFSTISSWALDFSKLNLYRSAYYVKIGGTGDGSSWENALGNTEFNYVLANTRNGATFHIAAGKYVPTLDKNSEVTTGANACYYVKRSVTLIGGYPAKPTDGSVSNPSNNVTLFSADVKGNNIATDYSSLRDDDLTGCLIIQDEDGYNVNVKVYGITFEGTKKGTYPFNTPFSATECTLDVERCTFSGCLNGMSFVKCNVNITNCTFENNSSALLWTIGNFNITKSTFKNNLCVDFSPLETYAFGTEDYDIKRVCNVSNCTFLNNKTFYVEGKAKSEVNLTNNTIVMRDTTFTVDSKGQVNLTGNIINAKNIVIGKDFEGSLTSKYNYYAYTGKLDSKFKSGKDWESNSCPFLANKLANNGGFTETIALLKDTVSGGKSIRFPRTECNLIEDQRKMKRAENTCVGAYEFGATVPAPTYRTYGPDTTIVGVPYFADNKIHPIGRDTFVKSLKDAAGNDSIIITYYLFVMPRYYINDYYVTKTGRGNKSGLSWENAMNDSSFAFAFPLVADNTTFHIAEGIYHPMFDENANSPKDFKERTFHTQRSVNLIGGYSEKDTTLAPDASKYKTILSGDLKENNTDLYYDKNSDDVKQLLVFEPWRNITSRISNIYFEGSQITMMQDALISVDARYLKWDSTAVINLEIDSCQFRNSTNFITADKTAIDINNCVFKGCSDLKTNMRITAPNAVVSKIENSSFDNVSLQLNGINSELKNNTINDLNIYNSSNSEGKVNTKLYNNTITGSCSFSSGSCQLVGNIFTGLVDFDSKMSIKSNRNLFNINTMKSTVSVGTTDILAEESGLHSLLDSKNNLYLLQDNGGFAPTIAIVTDILPDGRSIRFPSAETDAKTDQRGAERLGLTCPGAFEAECYNHEFHSDEIEYISIDNTYFGKKFETTGLKTYIQAEKNQCGGDSLIFHNVMVTPSLKKNIYYVKSEKSGVGDGSSWENAMGDTLFAYTLANVKSKATFHVAEGTYMPYVNGVLVDTTSLNNRFIANRSVCIIGGYPKNITDENQSAKPAKYTTLFCGNVETSASSAYDYKILQIYTADDDSTVVSGISFRLNSEKALTGENLLGYSPSATSSGWLLIDHCTFENAPSALMTNGHVSISSSRFRNTKTAFNLFMHPMAIYISGCEFSGNTSVSSYFDESFTMSNSTFVDGLLSISGPTVSLYNNTLLCDSISISNDSETKIIGNIIQKISCSDDAIKNSKYNLSLQSLGGTNITTEDLSDILNFDFGKKVFILGNEGNFINGVQVISDKTTDGKSIKFPVSETTVYTDQWERDRFESTCVGALEAYGLNCEIVEIYAEKTDTIYCDSTIYGVTLHQEGDFEVVEELYTADGCDSVVHHKVVVLARSGVENIIVDLDEIFSTDNEIFIYNVQGILLFHSRNGWDGKTNGLPAGVYVYTIISKDGVKKNGKIEIKQ